jgi:hypothetical protein
MATNPSRSTQKGCLGVGRTFGCKPNGSKPDMMSARGMVSRALFTYHPNANGNHLYVDGDMDYNTLVEYFKMHMCIRGRSNPNDEIYIHLTTSGGTYMTIDNSFVEAMFAELDCKKYLVIEGKANYSGTYFKKNFDKVYIAGDASMRIGYQRVGIGRGDVLNDNLFVNIGTLEVTENNAYYAVFTPSDKNTDSAVVLLKGQCVYDQEMYKKATDICMLDDDVSETLRTNHMKVNERVADYYMDILNVDTREELHNTLIHEPTYVGKECVDIGLVDAVYPSDMYRFLH